MRTKKALYNIITQFSYEIVAMVCGLILPRIILSFYGSSYNGMVSSITQFLDYISILTLGVAGSTRVAIYKASAKNDIKKQSAILKATEIYMRKIAIIFIVYMIALVFIYPYIVRNEFSWIESASLVIIIGLGVFAEYFFGITYSTYLSAKQSMYIYKIIQIFTKMASTIISIILIFAGQPIQIVKLVSAVCFVVSPLILNIIVRKKFGIIKDVEPDKAALKQRKDVMAHSIANCVHQYTDIFLLTMASSTKIVSVYSVYNMILASLQKLQTIFTTGLEGAFGELWARGERENFEKNFSTFEFLMFAFVSVVFSCAVILILPFVEIYTKDINDTNYILPVYAGMAVLTYGIFCLRTPYLIAVQAAGKYKETKKGAFIEAGLNFTISLIGVFKLNLIGVTLGTLVANTFRTVQYAVFISKRMLKNRSFYIFIMKCVWLGFNVSIILMLRYLLPIIPNNTWLLWCLNGVYYFVIALIVTIITSLIFYRTEMKNSVEVLKNMLKIKSSRKKERGQ